MPEETTNGRPLLDIIDLNAGYGDAQALWDISLTVKRGESVTIIGPNGAGKTTLVNALAGILPVRSGQIMLEEYDLTRVAAHQICSRGIAVVPEGRRLFPKMSVRDNLDLGSYIPEARPHHDEMLERVTIIFPRLKERAQQLAGTLSGGEQQMLAIGRALMARPKLLLLDEPSLGLAPVIVDTIFETLTEINQAGVSILMVEQNVTKALAFAARGYVLEQGRIVQEGSTQSLLRDDHVKQAYLGLYAQP
ncbi:MAG TPA: ABC transporter ATP-binding protein [Anaerolineae bacterium]|jgi:branched-chain amino acid transport system ATP-binding protein